MPLTALIALLAWPLVTAILMSRLPLQTGIIWSLLGGMLLLPVGIGIDLPAIPTFDKIAIPSLTLFVILLARGEAPHLPGISSPTIKAFIALIVIQPVLTALANSDSFFQHGIFLRGFSLYDAGSILMRSYITIIPFLLGYKYLGSPDSHRKILLAVLAAGLAYSVLALIELWLGPRLHIMLYGYFQHNWLQMLRGGGVRPIVFLDHALWVAFFTMIAMLAALIAWKSQGRTLYLGMAAYLVAVIVLGKSLGALMLAVVMGMVVVLAGARLQIRIAAVLVGFALLYPALRGADLAPVYDVVEFARGINEARAGSLGFRLENEDILLAHANERPFLGWGGVGRNLVYQENGENIIPDGYWVIVIGQSGWIGYLATFGLLCVPVLLMSRQLSQARSVGPVTAGLALILAANMVELLPNSTLMPITWLIAGAILGFVEQRREHVSTAEPSIPKALPRKPRTIL